MSQLNSSLRQLDKCARFIIANTLILVDQTHKRDLYVEVGGQKGHRVALVIFSVDKCANKVKVLIISTLDVNIEIEKSSFDVLSHDLFIGKIITHSI